MGKIAIIYWSGTGNTEAMAKCIAESAKDAGAKVDMMGPAEFSAARFSEFSAAAFGCPAMGSEVLEESDFDPMFTCLLNAVSPILIFFTLFSSDRGLCGNPRGPLPFFRPTKSGIVWPRKMTNFR